MPARRMVITGPDIDKLAEGLYAAEILAQLNTIRNLTETNRVLKAHNKQLRKDLKAMTNSRDSLLKDLMDGRESRKRLARRIGVLKSQLINNGITPLEDK